MKKTYMVEFRIPQPIDEDFARQITHQQKNVHELMLEGKIITYTLSEDKKKLWSVMSGDERSDIHNIIHRLPLSRWMKIKINELTFHGEARSWNLPVMSMN